MKPFRELFFDELGEPYRFHIGMRMVKTVIAVFICAIIGWLRGESPFFAMIAAVLCMQTSTEKALVASFNRTVGTLIGGAFGVALLSAETLMHLQRSMPLYYLVVSVALIPIISIAMAIRKPTAAAFSCVVFLSVAIHHVGDAIPYAYALNRMLDTVAGIVVSLLVNLTLPAPSQPDPEPEAEENTEDNKKPGV